MVSSKEGKSGGLIYNMKLSSVGPGRYTGQDIVHEPNDMDLAMKLHYLKGVYYFPSQAFDGLTIRKIKEPLFIWFNHFYITCGRFRRSEESGRPVIKCNDCGARFIEAQCDKTLDEWLEMKKHDPALEKLLVSDKIVGPELGFSPLVFLQYTKFKCGGMAVGLSWTHVLGDAFSAAEFMNVLGRVLAGEEPQRLLNTAQSLNKNQDAGSPKSVMEDPLSVKRVGPVEDKWITVNTCNMGTFSFHVTPTELSDIQSKISGKYGPKIAPFESLCAVIWKCVAKIRHGNEPKVVTICKKDSRNKGDGRLSNSQMISVVKADFAIAKASHEELAAMIKNQAIDERKKIEEAMERDQGLADFEVYGANLTFVNYEDANFHGFEYNGTKQVGVSYWIDGVGDEGAVLVLPGPNDGGFGRIVRVILPENEIVELRREWSIA
ncbi:unnamed protein product [Coffea canephora]|uniref:Protein ECERIFERUM 26-like n=2 Tax=Coffea TaxID=13442 RepID=A0A068URP2_COFCA|nr:protein ECERIFERUM 26-like [Coffea arabica]CDP11175.1 unnamed protein product [Coffea canephora]